MHIVFLNPQGNFDNNDSYLAEHPDFGGQLVYVKEVAKAMASLGHQVDIVTRRMDDPDWPEFSDDIAYYSDSPGNPRIIRIPCGGDMFLQKEHLWPHLEEFVDNLVAFYGNEKPDYFTSHYADGGYCAVLMQQKTGAGFTFTGHSLGAQKLDKLGVRTANFEEMDKRYLFSKRIGAERMAMEYADTIITSTNQERLEQYAHPLYQGAVDVHDDDKFSVVPPGVNLSVFNKTRQKHDSKYVNKLDRLTRSVAKPWIVVSSRLDEKKNILGVVKAYSEDTELQETAGLAICIRGVDDPFKESGSLSDREQEVLKPILAQIETTGIRDKVIFLNIQSQQELAASYRYFADKGSLFALTAYYEPFGLAPIEAAACGLVCVATQNGGPSEIFEDGSGVLVDPFDSKDIARGLKQALADSANLSTRGYQRVIEKYTWDKTAEGYLQAIKATMQSSATYAVDTVKVETLDETFRIESYLKESAST